MPERELNSKLAGYVSDEDDQYEFIQQNQEFRQKQKDGAQLEFSSDSNIATDEANFSQSLCAVNNLAGCAPAYMPKHADLPLKAHKIECPNIASDPGTTCYSFDDLLKKLSSSARKKLKDQNLDNQTVLSRIDGTAIKKLDFARSDQIILRNLVLQCRATELKNQKQKAKTSSKMPANVITDQLPITGPFTIKVLKKQNLLSPVQLYLMTPIAEIQKLFARFPAIPEHDQKNILAGMALARYVRKSS